MRSFYTLSIWILLGTFAGYGLLTLLGLGDKNEYSSRAFNFEKSASSVVNIWSLRRWREWQEKTPSLGLRRWKQVIKTGFFPDGSGVIFDHDKWSKSRFHNSDRVIIVDSFSKNYLLQGARVAATLVPSHVTENLINIHQTILSAAPAPAQNQTAVNKPAPARFLGRASIISAPAPAPAQNQTIHEKRKRARDTKAPRRFHRRNRAPRRDWCPPHR